MRLFCLFIFLCATNLFCQEYNRTIDFLGYKEILYNDNYIEIQDFTNSFYEESNPCMNYFERIETSLNNFEIEIVDKEFSENGKDNISVALFLFLKYLFNLFIF